MIDKIKKFFVQFCDKVQIKDASGKFIINLSGEDLFSVIKRLPEKLEIDGNKFVIEEIRYNSKAQKLDILISK